MNKLTIIGQMTELVLKPISSAEFKELKLEGVNGKLYQRLINETYRAPALFYGYSSLALGSDFEVYLNQEPLHIKRTFVKSFRATYKPIVRIKDSMNLVITRTYRDGRSELEFEDEFQPEKLVFELNRFRVSKQCCSGVIPTYIDQSIPFVSSWNDTERSFIASSETYHSLNHS
jgi:hypothetical protein